MSGCGAASRMVASGDGASVQWIGAACPGQRETATYSTVCEFQQVGQVIISNPTTLGLGNAISVTIKITELAR